MSTTTRPINRSHGNNRAPRDHYQEVTDRVIAALEAGTPPWRKPWDPDKTGGPAMPRNAATGQRYRGINVLTLGMSAQAFISGDPRWATYKQAEDRGWQVRKGERGTTGYFFKKLELRDDSKPDDSEDSVRRIPLLRAFTLFHASQIDGVPDYLPPTGEEAPLNRDLRNHFGSHDYAREELRAEIGQMMICGELGIAVSDSDFSNNAAYVASWLEKLRSDRKEIFRAAADAQRIADYLLAFHPEYAASQT